MCLPNTQKSACRAAAFQEPETEARRVVSHLCPTCNQKFWTAEDRDWAVAPRHVPVPKWHLGKWYRKTKTCVTLVLEF